MTQVIKQEQSLRETAGKAGDSQVNQYLTFSLADEYYGVDILRVQEIKGWTPVTQIPNAPAYLKGVLNLRGVIVPIVDLRMRFNLESVEYTPTTVVIVLSLMHEDRERTFGIVVDAVSDVLNFAPEDIRPKPDFGTVVDADFISGLATLDKSMVMLLDIDRLLRPEELSAISRATE
ncbi:chemotaxis protein CheW [Thioalkalivibrio denitrificans]|jgi:purine-binding chemotaxis protein CheW|uniref:Chemotaxis protein CheW n=1 Tax=Thioalkalivibrio denitrificans TaxID=108003 RepID=A0A1V3NH20_9GAMM|nr:chemotaxis protein CheW [Thioalkalivibrio denitrificans]OOG24243.1 chemotaxis protein CheW [Thioalkalivibrio denitrificans]